jgi:hypothetical protein
VFVQQVTVSKLQKPAAVETAPGTHEKIVLYAPFKTKALSAAWWSAIVHSSPVFSSPARVWVTIADQLSFFFVLPMFLSKKNEKN